jgi:anti-anti-sigma factor
MGVENELVGDTAILYLKDRFDLLVYEEFKLAFSRYLGAVRYFRIDLSGVTNLDSSALGMLLLLRERAGEHCEILLVHPTPDVLRTLQVAQFHRLFTIEA